MTLFEQSIGGAQFLGGKAACFACKRPFTAEDGAARANAEAYQRAQAREAEEERLEAEARARSEGEEAGRVDSRGELSALQAELTVLRANQADAVEEKVEQRLVAERRNIEAERTALADDRQALIKQAADRDVVIANLNEDLAKTKRQLEQQTPNTLGKRGEFVLLTELRPHFPEDKIKPVRPGAHGADVIMDVEHQGLDCGRLLLDSKNVTGFRENWITKIKNDMLDAGAVGGVLVSPTMPKESDAPIAFRDNVVVAPPELAVSVVRFLRWGLIKVALARATGKNVEGKHQELWSYMANEGRPILVLLCEGVEEWRTIDNDLAAYFKRQQKKSEGARTRQQERIAELLAALDRIITGN